MEQLNELDRNWLRQILEDGFFSDPRRFRNEYDYTPSPIEDMLGSSPALDYVRQKLPETLGDTAAGRWLDRKLQNVEPDTIRGGIAEQLQDLPLGGFSQEALDYRDQLRAEDPLVRRNTVQAGMVNTPDGAGEVPIGDSFRAGAAQAAGVALGDAATDGLRNVWWFLNAPQALASLAVLQAIHAPAKQQAERLNARLGMELPEGERVLAPYGSRTVRLASVLPAVIGTSMAIGNAYRQPGYAAAVPSEADRTQTADPLAELGSRYFLGRTGALLPYDEFVKERPDVSKGEYEAYKAYLFGSASPIKASLDGINGPEVSFMGKSIPVLTGIAPAVAGIVGARRGMRKAMDRLEAEGDQLLQAEKARIAYRQAERQAKRANSDEGPPPTQEEINKLKHKFQDIQRRNEVEILKQTLLGSAKYLAPTALAGQTIESIRRSVPQAEPIEEPLEATPPPKSAAKKAPAQQANLPVAVA